MSMEGIWNITFPKKEGKNFIIACKYLFSLQVNTNGRPKVFEARGEGPKIQEAYHSFLNIYIYTYEKQKISFLEVIVED